MPGSQYDPSIMRKHLLAVLVLGALGACATTSTGADSPAAGSSSGTVHDSSETLEQGRELTRQFLVGELDLIWARMTENMRDAIGSEEKLAEFRQAIESQAGEETEVLDEQVTAQPPFLVYLRTAAFSKTGGAVVIQWALDSDGKIAGFFVRPAK